MAVFWSIAIAFALSMLRSESRLVTIPAFVFGIVAGIAATAFGYTAIPRSLDLHELFDGRVSVGVFWGMAAAMLFSGIQWLLQKRAGRTPDADTSRLIEGLTDGARSTLGIVATCACAGIIVSIVNLSGIGQTISTIIVSWGAGNTLLILLMAAFAMWILGLSVPVTASYIIAAVMLVPALVSRSAVQPPCRAHVHVLLRGARRRLAADGPGALRRLPPSAGGEPFRTTMQAWKYTLPAFLVPFMFCLTPEGAQLLMLVPAGTNAAGAAVYGLPGTFAAWASVLWITLTSCVALIGFCVAFAGYAFGRATPLERLICLVGGCLLLVPFGWAVTAGFACLVVGLGLHWRRLQHDRLAAGG